ncbi:YafY family transcriptional regulator [Arachnia propionica]|uniref:YafY family transcriptional regulator n=1 Tax=Arachnia propionica TaxID=1750 RepID=A0A3P1T8G3_9ACTN|nr:YafY family protein [Arachnia propionica]RRD05734.1 YafY family transcriptional regulator [Arachnia propionica]
MSTISARVLELLTLLQSRRHWSGDELARRLEISPRTLRRDVESLQDLGYPITTTRGTGGGYQLAPGGSLPPLVLNEDEATAVVIAMKDAATGNHPTEATAAVTALAKIVQVLPTKIRRRIDSLQRMATLPGPYGTPATVDTSVLTTIALAARDHETITFDYTDAKGASTSRRVHPHHVVSLGQRLYLIAHDLDRADWRIFRIDRASNPNRTRQTFTPKLLPVEDPAEYVRSRLHKAWTVYEVTATAEAPAADVQVRLGRWGEATPITENSCAVRIPTGDLDWATFALAALHATITIHGPEEAITHAAAWGSRLTAAANP